MNDEEIKNIKLNIIDALINSPYEAIEVPGGSEIRMTCPFCGKGNLNKKKMYMKIDPNDNYPIVYHCFKCEESDRLKPEMLEAFGIDYPELVEGLTKMNSRTISYRTASFNDINSGFTSFDYKLPPIKLGYKTEYISNRLGHKFTKEDFKDMKVIASLRDFLIYNKIKEITMEKRILELFEDSYVGFLSNGASHILFRSINDNTDWRWVKYPITNISRKNKIFYTISGEIDIFTKGQITINMTEGIMDIISAKYNLGFDYPNTMNVAVTGKYYTTIIERLITLGLFGDNVKINIFSDNDAVFGKPNEATTFEGYKRRLHDLKDFFGEINIFYNTIGKDIGVPRDKISLKRFMI